MTRKFHLCHPAHGRLIQLLDELPPVVPLRVKPEQQIIPRSMVWLSVPAVTDRRDRRPWGLSRPHRWQSKNRVQSIRPRRALAK